jgi:hypothetical protein
MTNDMSDIGRVPSGETSLPGLTRQSILFRKTLAKIDGYAGQARV